MSRIHHPVDFVSVVYIVKENTVLLADHIHYNMWLPIGGHVEINENPEETAYRESQEECGLSIELIGTRLPEIQGDTTKPLITPAYMDIHDRDEKEKHVVFVYFAKYKDGNPTLEPSEHRQLKWFTANELRDTTLIIKPFVRNYANEALKRAI